MAEDSFELQGTIDFNARNCINELNNLDKKVTKSQGAFTKFAEGVGKLGEKLTKTLTVGLGAIGIKGLQMSSDLNEALSKCEVVYGNNMKTVEKWSKSLIKSHGITQEAALTTSSVYAAMGKSMGLESQVFTDYSLKLTELASDLASFHNTRIDVAQTALNSIYTGETETLKQYGIVMTEANLQQWAYSQGITKSIQKMTQAEKVQLRYNYVMAMTSDAHGDFERTNDQLANSLRILKANFDTFITNLMGRALPTVNKLVNLLNRLLEHLNGLSDAQMDFIFKIGLTAVAIGPLLLGFSKVTLALQGIQKFLGLGTLSFIKFASVIGILVGGAMIGLNENIRVGFVNIVNNITNGINNASNNLKANLDNFIENGEQIVVNIIKGISYGIVTLGIGVLRIVEAIGDAIIKNAPSLAKSGVVLVKGIIQGIIQSIPIFYYYGRELIFRFKKAIKEVLPSLKETGSIIINSLGSAIKKAVPHIESVATSILKFLSKMIENRIKFLANIGIKIIEFIKNDIIPHLPKLIETAQNIISNLLKGLVTSLPKLTKIGMDLILAIIDGIMSILPKLNEIFGKIAQNFIKGLKILLEQLPSMVQTLVNGILTAINNQLPKLVEFLIGLGQTIIDSIQDILPKLIEVGVKIFNSILRGIISAIPGVGRVMSTMVYQLVLWVLENIPVLIENGKKLAMGLLQGLQDAMPLFWQKILEFEQILASKFKEFIPKLIPAALRAIGAICDGLTQGIPELLAKVGYIMYEFIRAFLNKLPDIIACGWDMLKAFVMGLWDNRAELYEATNKLIHLIPNMSDGAIKGLKSIGSSIIDSFIDGVADNWYRFTTWLSNKISAIPIVGKLFDALSGKSSSGGDDAEPHAVGGVFTRPTLLPSLGGKTHLVGEAGPEAIVPLKALWKENQNAMINTFNAVRGTDGTSNVATNSILNKIIELLTNILDKDNNLYLDGKELSNAISPYGNDILSYGNRYL